MPDPTTLKVGDRIRILAVPEGDLRQHERGIREGAEDAGCTADTIERIIRQDPIVTISRIDEYGSPWFYYELRCEDGTVEQHTLAIVDEKSWERV
ncbi:MAG: hypothetical protein KKI02_11040 [Planctomycetes bacterium]|nr:hypothetical protein [Planctomycetota bacterium]